MQDLPCIMRSRLPSCNHCEVALSSLYPDLPAVPSGQDRAVSAAKIRVKPFACYDPCKPAFRRSGFVRCPARRGCGCAAWNGFSTVFFPRIFLTAAKSCSILECSASVCYPCAGQLDGSVPGSPCPRPGPSSVPTPTRTTPCDEGSLRQPFSALRHGRADRARGRAQQPRHFFSCFFRAIDPGRRLPATRPGTGSPAALGRGPGPL